jgi:hypothetical protein
MRPQPQPADLGGLLHPVDVAIDSGVIDQDARGPEVADVHPGILMNSPGH